MKETEIHDFWNSHPCGEQFVDERQPDFKAFFDKYDAFRYKLEDHIPRCLDQIDFKGKKVLEIGLGQGADSEQIIRRGAVWSGLDLTEEAVDRTRTRLKIRGLPYQDIKVGSALTLPWPERTFDIVYSHGVLHHIPDIKNAQREIARVLKPGGQLVMMVYAKYSLNYLVSIAIVRRAAVLIASAIPFKWPGLLGEHVRLARQHGIFRYLRLKNFIHRNTDGPLNPYSKVYSVSEIEKDFPNFRILKTHKHFMHAPPLPVHGMPGASLLGWHLWAHLEPKLMAFQRRFEFRALETKERDLVFDFVDRPVPPS